MIYDESLRIRLEDDQVKQISRQIIEYPCGKPRLSEEKVSDFLATSYLNGQSLIECGTDAIAKAICDNADNLWEESRG